MAGDDILWKNVEAMKHQSRVAPKHAPSRQQSGQKGALRRVQVSPSGREDKRAASPLSASTSSSTDTGNRRVVRPHDNDTPGVRTSARTAVRPYGRLMQMPARPVQRRPERYAFQFWADQITRLKFLRHTLNAAMNPEDRTEITLSDLVREAIDEYLDRQTQPVEPAARTAVRPSP